MLSLGIVVNKYTHDNKNTQHHSHLSSEKIRIKSKFKANSIVSWVNSPNGSLRPSAVSSVPQEKDLDE
jgi:hypothetical protein